MAVSSDSLPYTNVCGSSNGGGSALVPHSFEESARGRFGHDAPAKPCTMRAGRAEAEREAMATVRIQTPQEFWDQVVVPDYNDFRGKIDDLRLGSVDIHLNQIMAPTSDSMAANESAVFS